ncbi:hypothetical protein GCK32_001534 [Trichostrongylus colubriformis]|uniref:Uncharacterized protein n=1 Tax=Trichostrongylus colubriformis TaxID=6319 RepID=A0AAN8FS15_TRICO
MDMHNHLPHDLEIYSAEDKQDLHSWNDRQTVNIGATIIPVVGNPFKHKKIVMGRIIVKSERTIFGYSKILKGVQFRCRMSLLNLSIDRQSEERLVSNSSISTNYFNQSCCGTSYDAGR